ncbi:MAG: hypothetical protein KDB26_07845 [Microthrixaceae bacterium]|nr:hypothetical protein [Microthrixaceae bacterium]
MTTDLGSESPGEGRLIEERDHLLASIRDLDREFGFGDMSEADYERLRQEYTVRAADVIRAIERGETDSSDLTPPATKNNGRWKLVGISTVVVVFAVASGFMVARSSGQRGSNAITGSQGTIREQLATCQTLSFQKPEQGIDCYADILKKAPDNVEALTYQGWAYVRTDDIKSGGANFARVVEIDPDYPDVRVFRAVMAVRGEDFEAAAEEVSLFYRNDPSPMAIQVLQSQGLEREIYFGLLPGPVRMCWQKAAEAGKDSEQLDGKFYGALATCLDEVLASTPSDAEALVSRGYAAAGLASMDKASTMDAAEPFLEKALSVDPVNGNALMLRASLLAVNARGDEAKEVLQQLENLPRPTISFLVGGPEQVAEGL